MVVFCSVTCYSNPCHSNQLGSSQLMHSIDLVKNCGRLNQFSNWCILRRFFIIQAIWTSALHPLMHSIVSYIWTSGLLGTDAFFSFRPRAYTPLMHRHWEPTEPVFNWCIRWGSVPHILFELAVNQRMHSIVLRKPVITTTLMHFLEPVPSITDASYLPFSSSFTWFHPRNTF
jgi:hypothetical protein